MPKPRNPHPETGAPTTDLDLEAQIVRAEKAVIARDARIRDRTDLIVHRVKHEALRHAGGGLAVGIGTLALAWWLKRRAAKAAPPPPPPDTQPSHAEDLAREAGLSIAGLLPMIWPMLPHAIRRNVTPGTVSTLLTFVTPWVARLFRRGKEQTAH